MTKLFFAVFSFFFFQAAHGNIVFIDLNNVEAEIAVAKQEAARRGQKLIVLPVNRKAYITENKAALQVLRQLDRAHSRFDNCLNSGRNNCSQFQNEIFALEEKYDSTPRLNYGATELKKDLESLKIDISTVMISGHDGEASFNGDFGSISSEDFLSVFNDFQGSKNVRSVYLLGCHSVTAHTVGSVWKRSFPNAKLIAGYEHTGFLRENANGHNFIRRLLRNEEQILSSSTTTEALKKFRALAPQNPKYGAAACYHSDDQEPYFLSSVNGSQKPLIEALGCKGLDHEFLECALAGKENCPFPKGGASSRFENIRSCLVALDPQKVKIYEKSLDQIYFLGLLFDDFSEINPRRIFSQANPAVRKKLRLDEPISDMGTFKKRLRDLKDHYESEATFENLAGKSNREIQDFQWQKEYFDRVWLSVSNLSPSAYFNRTPQPRPAEFKAQLFYQHAIQNKLSPTAFEDRIQELTTLASQTPNSNTRNELSLEKSALQKLQEQFNLLKLTD